MKVKTEFLLKAAILFVSGMIIMLLFSSCNRYTLYQTQAAKGSAPANAEMPEKMLEAGDKISLSIWGHDELSIGSIHTVYNSPDESASGKWVMIDANGEVNLPQIGKVKLEGLTVANAEKQLKEMYSKQIQNPILSLRVLNNQVTLRKFLHRLRNLIKALRQRLQILTLNRRHKRRDQLRFQRIGDLLVSSARLNKCIERALR